MPFNGSGVYTPPGTDFPAVPSTLIESSKYNAMVNDQSTALSTCITKDGQTTITANLPMSGYKHTNVAAGASRTDYAAMSNLQDRTGVYVATVGGTADAITLTPSPAIAAYAAGQQFSFIASGANTGAVTVNVSGLGAKAVTKNGATALVAGDIPASSIILIEYDGTQFQLVRNGAVSLGAITTSGLTMSTARILGRTTASAGAVEEISVGASLTLSGGSLSGTAASDSQAGVIEIAVQSEMEAASSTTLAVTPGRMIYHPGIVKVAAQFGVSGNIRGSSYNVSSITDSGTGLAIVNYSITMSNSQHPANATVYTGQTENFAVGINSTVGQTTTSTAVSCINSSTAGLTDPAVGYNFMATGDI